MSRDVEQRRTEVVDELVVIVVDIIVNLVMVNYFDVASKRMWSNEWTRMIIIYAYTYIGSKEGGIGGGSEGQEGGG